MTWILAQQPGGGTDQLIQLVNYGVLGLAILGAALGWVAFRPEIQRLLKEIDRQHGQVDSLIKVYEEKVIPVLTEANHTLARLAEERRRRGGWEDGYDDGEHPPPRRTR